MDTAQTAGNQLTGAYCAYCSEPAAARCTHHLTETWIVYPHEVKVGDMIEHSLTLEFYRCVAVKPPARPIVWTDALDHEPDPYVLVLAIGSAQHREQAHSQTLPLLRKESRPCGALACDRHLRDFGDDHFQCANHWDNWTVYSADA